MAQPDVSPASAWTPRLAWAWALALCTLAALTLAWPALSGGFLVNPHSDQYIAGFPFRDFAAESLRAGNGFPLWNPYLFGGMPFVAAMHGDIFYPTFLLRLIMPTDVAMTWGFILHLILAGVATIGFLRATGMTFLPAAVGGVAYMLSGQIASLVSPGHDGKLFVNALLPLALWAILRGVRDGAAWAWGVLALVVGLGVLSPHPQLLQYMLLAAGAFALFVSLSPLSVARRAPDDAPIATTVPPRRLGVTRLGLALVAVGIGFVIGAVQYLPVMEYVPWSPRAGGQGYDFATSYSMPLEETINVWLPQFSGILDAYWGRNGIHFHSEYLGVAALCLAAAGLVGGVAPRTRRHAWFWLGVAFIAQLWAWGGNTPFYHLVYALVPGSKFFRAPSTIFFLTSFGVAVLAAYGAERALAGRITQRFAIGIGIFAVAVALIATAGGFTNFAYGLLGSVRGLEIEANASAVVAGAWRSAAVALVLVVLLVLRLRDRMPARTMGIALLVLVTADLWSIDRHYWMFSEPAESLYAPDEAIQYVKAQPQPARVWNVGFNIPGIVPRDPFYGGDALMQHDVRIVEGYHGNELGRYRELARYEGAGQLIANPNFWQLTNTQFLYTNLPELDVEGSRLVAGPVRNAAGSMVYLYDLPGEQPYAWVVPLRTSADDQSTLATVLNPRFDLSRAALFPDSGSAIEATPAQDITALPPAVDASVRVTSYAPGAVDLTIEGAVPEGAALVVSENFYPGWTATVDGQPATVERANFVLTGVALPANATQVSLRFTSPTYERGKQITLLALALAVLWTLVGIVVAARRGGGDDDAGAGRAVATPTPPLATAGAESQA